MLKRNFYKYRVKFLKIIRCLIANVNVNSIEEIANVKCQLYRRGKFEKNERYGKNYYEDGFFFSGTPR